MITNPHNLPHKAGPRRRRHALLAATAVAGMIAGLLCLAGAERPQRSHDRAGAGIAAFGMTVRLGPLA